MRQRQSEPSGAADARDTRGGAKRRGRPRVCRPAVRLLAAALAVAAAAGGQTRAKSWDKTAPTVPSPARLLIWTDSPGYTTWRHTIRAYLAMQPMGDRREFYRAVYLEHVASGKRRYWQGPERGRATADAPPPPWRATDRLPDLGPMLVWSGRVPEPGAWRFVAELRSPDRTELIKRVAASFVVSWKIPLVLGSGGSATEILSDTTWGTDRIRVLRGPVYVHAGTTLTLEPGTLVLARGTNAAIIVERGGRIVAQGRPDAPVILTCEAAAGEREPGCWGGLALLGRAPTREWNPTAPALQPAARGVYGGDDSADSSGALRYLRVEFAGAGPDGAGLGFYGVGSETAIEHVQSHASGGAGIRFAGGAANCARCVSSGAVGHGIAWGGGWAGRLQHVYVQQDGPGTGCGIEAGPGGAGPGLAQGGLPQVFNATLVKSGEARPGCDAGIVFRPGAQAAVRNLAATGYRGGAVRFEDGPAGPGPAGGGVSHLIADSVGNGGDSTRPDARHLEQDPKLVNVRWEGGPDPRPRLESPALPMGAAAVAPSDGWFDTGADYVGAFNSRNWLEEWTRFGPESEYAQPGADTASAGSVVEATSESSWSPDPPGDLPGTPAASPAGTDVPAVP